MRRAWLGAAAWLLAYAAATAAVQDSELGRRVLGQFVYDVPAVLAAVLAVRAWRAVRGPFWGLTASAAVLLAVGDVVYTAYPYLGGAENPFPSWADAAYLAGGFSLLAALLVGFARASGLRWVRASLDGGLITLGVAAVAWPVLAPSPAGAPVVVDLLAVGYPMLVVGACVFWASVGLAGHRRVPVHVKLVGAALAVKALSSLGFAYTEAQAGGYLGGSWLDLLFQLSPVLLCLAARSAAPAPTATPLRVDRELAPVALGVGAAPALVVAGAAAWDGQVSRAVLALVAAVVALLVARMLVSLADARRVGRELDAALTEQERLATQDQLTALHNRRYFDEALARACRRSSHDGSAFGLLVLDLDHFKAVNDVHGHQAGDEVLRQAASRLSLTVRPSDVLARYGGEEFVVLAPTLAGAALHDAGERLCAAVRSSPFVLADGTQVALTLSVGAASFPDLAQDATELVRQADRALYAAKAGGRDRTVAASGASDRSAAAPATGAVERR